MSKPTSPCYGCDHRAVGCHGDCDEYQTFRSALDDYRQMVREQQPLRVIKPAISKWMRERLDSSGKRRK